jgi:hypothetical protein
MKKAFNVSSGASSGPPQPSQDDVKAFIAAARDNDGEEIGRYLAIFATQIVDRGNEFGTTAIILAASEGHRGIVTQLLEGGADIEARNYVGNTALLLATSHGHCDVVAHLLGNGANVSDSAAIEMAKWCGNPDIAALLRAEPARRDMVRRRREMEEEIAAVYAGVPHDLEPAVPLCFRKKAGPQNP